MINNIILKNFRGFKNFQAPITPITVFGGRNNAGKSSILEAFTFLFSHSDPNCFFQMNFFRHMNDQMLYTADRLWEPLFFNFDTSEELAIIFNNDDSTSNCLTLVRGEENNISTVFENQKQAFLQAGGNKANYILEFNYESKNVKENGYYALNQSNNNMQHPVNIVYRASEEKQNKELQAVLFFKSETILNPNDLSQWFGNLVLQDKKNLVIEALQYFDKDIADIQTIVKGAYGYLYALFKDGKKIPLSYMGDGMNRMLNILLAILSMPKSIILIDEFENGFHYSMYKKIWEIIGKAAVENECQLIVNTHSRDLLKGAVEALKEENLLNKFSYVRLAKNTSDDVQAKVFDAELIEYALRSEMEVR